MNKQLFQFSSIRTRLLAWSSLLVFISLFLFAAGVYWHRVSSLRERTRERFTLLRDVGAGEVNAWVDRVRGDIAVMANNALFQQASRSLCANGPGAAETAALDTLLRPYLLNFDQYVEFFIISAGTGRIVYSTDKARVGYDCSGMSYFSEAMKGREVYIRDYPFQKEFDIPSITFSLPLQFGHLGPAGVLVGRLDLKKSLTAMQGTKMRFGETGGSLSVNRDFVALNLMEGDDISMRMQKINDEAAVMSLRGGTGLLEFDDYHGRRTIAAYTFIPRLNWGYMVKQEIDEVFRPAGEMLTTMTVLIIVLLGMASLVALAVARNISRPIMSLIGVASRIQRGDLNARNEVPGEDELSYLALSFNNMADAVVSELNFQKTCSDLIEIMVATIDISSFSSNLIMKLMEVTQSCIGAFYILTADGRDFTHLTSIGLDSEAIESFHAETLEGEFGRALTLRRVIRTEIKSENMKLKLRTVIGDVMPKELVTIPIVAHNTCVAIISLASLAAYPDSVIRILNQIGPVMSTAFSNILAIEERRKLSNELELKNRLLESKQDMLQRQASELQRQTEMVRRQNYTLQEQRKIVEESSRLKTEFLSNMSHELRTPLNSILSLSRVLQLNKNRALTEEDKTYIEIIERQGEHLLALINDILDLSRIESGRIDLKPRWISLSSVLSVITENVEQLAEDKGITITLQVPGDLPDIETDETRLYQILQNIIGNAVKFTEEGGVVVSAARAGESVRVVVADTGIGIDEEELPRIFEEFRQIDGTLTRKYEGTGLGLAIASKSAQLINGTIEVISTPGVGSTFTVTLPVSIVEAKNGTREGRPGAGGEQKGKKRILVVEDDMDTVITLRALLQDDYELAEAFDGVEGIEAANREKPDCILLDIALPRMNGYMVAERLKGSAATREIPIIAMTALYLESDREKIFSAGCDDYLSKPFDIDGLKKTLEYWTVTRHEEDTGN